MDKPVCKYGTDCYRKNPQHFVEFDHPWIKKREADSDIDPLNPASQKLTKVQKALELKSDNTDMNEFPNAFDSGDYGTGVEPYTLVELGMMDAMAAIKEKPEWWLKVHKKDITDKWKKELFLLDSQADWIIEELKHYR